MRKLEEILEDSPEKPAFPNGTSWDIWSYSWCQRCANDVNEDCPLILAGFMHYHPKEWVETGPQRYECTEFEPREEVQQ
jgi:hypothetical protein